MAACMSARIREPRTNCKAVGRRSPLQTDDGSVWCRCRQKRKETSTTVVATTDIPPHVTFGPYPCGLDFSIRTSDQPSSEMVVKVSENLYDQTVDTFFSLNLICMTRLWIFSCLRICVMNV